jgi:endonuclease III-like uncharacterized protein
LVDGYTRRILERHEAVTAAANYDEIRLLVEHALATPEAAPRSTGVVIPSPLRPPVHPPSAMSTAQQSPLTRVYNEMHGLFVQVGKHYCHKQRADCEICPLSEMLSPGQRARLRSLELVGPRTRIKSRGRDL